MKQPAKYKINKTSVIYFAVYVFTIAVYTLYIDIINKYYVIVIAKLDSANFVVALCQLKQPKLANGLGEPYRY